MCGDLADFHEFLDRGRSAFPEGKRARLWGIGRIGYSLEPKSFLAPATHFQLAVEGAGKMMHD